MKKKLNHIECIKRRGGILKEILNYILELKSKSPHRIRHLHAIICCLILVSLMTASMCRMEKSRQISEQGIQVSTTDKQISVTNGQIELRFSEETGRWLSLIDPKDGEILLDSGNYLASVLLTVDGRTTIIRGQQQVWSIEDIEFIGTSTKLEDWRIVKEMDTTWFEIETVQGDWKIWQDYGFDSGSDYILRRVRIQWEGRGERLLRWVDLRTPSITQLGRATIAAPGYGFLYQPAEYLPTGQWSALPEVPGIDAPAWRLGIISVFQMNRTVCVWPFSNDIPSIMLIKRGYWGAWIEQRMLAACRLQPGQELEAGTQFIHLNPGPVKVALNHFHKFWDDVDVSLQGSTPDWGIDARIYEVQIGNMRNQAEISCKPYETVGDLKKDLIRIANMGFNIIQIMPHMPFPSYTVHDYFDIDVQYSPEEELRQMIDRAHELGLKVFLDVVLHGVTDKSINSRAIFDENPLLKEHPDWFSYTENDRVGMTYTYAFDHRNPSVQEYMVKVFSFYVERLNVDGFRVDAVTWNCFPNWAKNLSRPAYSSLWGTASMMELVRKEVHRIKPEVVFYNEAAGPLYYRSFDISYNYDEQWLYSAILSGRRPVSRSSRRWSEPGMTAQDLGEWLEMRRRSMPEGLMRIHHVDSHDSYYNSGSLYRKEMLGESEARMLFALAAFIDGGVMSFVGAETGSEEFYRRVLKLRESTPALQYGSCEYLTVVSENERVFSPLRRYENEWALPVLSFSKETITTFLPLKELNLEDDTVYALREAFSGARVIGKGRELKSLRVKLDPLSVQLWLPEKN
jgi:glycosidase